jgi:hypothetical protein
MLSTEIDDVVDYLEEASDLLGPYGVEMPTVRGRAVRDIVKAVTAGIHTTTWWRAAYSRRSSS